MSYPDTLDILTKRRKVYSDEGKTLHAAIIQRAIVEIQRHVNKQKTTQEVSTKVPEVEYHGVRDERNEPA